MTPAETGPAIPPVPPLRHEALTEIIHGVPVADPFRGPRGRRPRRSPAPGSTAQNERTRRRCSTRCPGAAGLHDRLAALLAGRLVGRLRGRPASGCSPSSAGATTTRACSSSASADPARDRPGPSSTRTCRPATPPRRSTGTARPPTAGWSPTACRPAATSAARCTIIDVETGRAPAATRSPTPAPRSVAWTARRLGLRLHPLPRPGDGPEEDRGYWRKVFWHRLGDRWRARRAACGATCPTRRRGPTSRSPPTGAGCSCTSRSGGAGSTSTSSTAAPARAP